MSFLKEKLENDGMAEKIEDTFEDEVVRSTCQPRSSVLRCFVLLSQERADVFTQAIMMNSHLNYKNVMTMFTRYRVLLYG